MEEQLLFSLLVGVGGVEVSLTVRLGESIVDLHGGLRGNFGASSGTLAVEKNI